MVDGSGLSNATQWFAVQVWGGREPLAARHLLARGYEVFMPSYREWRQWSDRRKSVERALFTGYVFCRVVSDVLAKIVSTPGVIRVVCDGSKPAPIDAEEIDTLQRVIAASLTARPWDFLRCDEPVHVIDGPLRGAQGIFVKAKNQSRLIISVSLLKRSVAVEIDPAWVEISSRTARSEIGYSFPIFDGATAQPQPRRQGL